MEFTEVVNARRSARSFTETKVAPEIIEEMLDAARRAPSSGNRQSHLFGIVEDEELKLALAIAAGSQMWIAHAPLIIACCATLEEDLRNMPEDDFSLIVNQTRFGKPFLAYLNQYEDRRIVKALFTNATPLIPAEHIFLTAVSHGLSACFVGYLDVLEASRVLQLPEDKVCLFLLPIGYAEEEPSLKEMKTTKEISFRNTFHIQGDEE